MHRPLEVLLPHDITVITDDETIAIARGSAPVPRAMEYSRVVGSLLLTAQGHQHEIPFQEIQYGRATQLPSYDPCRFKVVSKITIAGALRDGRPVDDLLYPFRPVRDSVTNEFLGARGLARAVPTQRRKDLFLDGASSWPVGTIALNTFELESTCPYPVRLLPLGEDAVTQKPIVEIPSAPQESAAEVIYQESLDERATDQLGLPVYNARPVGLKNDWSKHDDQDWRVCHIDTPQVATIPSPRHIISCDLVRDEHGAIVGGQGLARIAPQHFAEPIV